VQALQQLQLEGGRGELLIFQQSKAGPEDLAIVLVAAGGAQASNELVEVLSQIVGHGRTVQ
jgi:hypothetical protein